MKTSEQFLIVWVSWIFYYLCLATQGECT